jgi:hypothetical protein
MNSSLPPHSRLVPHKEHSPQFLDMELTPAEDREYLNFKKRFPAREAEVDPDKPIDASFDAD